MTPTHPAGQPRTVLDMAKVSSPARVAAAVLLFAVAGVVLPIHVLAGGDPAGHAGTAMHNKTTLVKATAIAPVRVALDKTVAPAGNLPAPIVVGIALMAVATGTVAVRGRRRVRLATAPSRGPPTSA